MAWFSFAETESRSFILTLLGKEVLLHGSLLLRYWLPLSLVSDQGGDTSAAHSDYFLLQPIGLVAALLLPPENEDLLFDRDRVEAVVQLPIRIHAPGVAALGVRDHPGETVVVLIDPVGWHERKYLKWKCCCISRGVIVWITMAPRSGTCTSWEIAYEGSVDPPLL